MYMINPKGIEEGVIKISDRTCIPNNSENSLWQMYQAWLNEDVANEPLEFDPVLLAYEEEEE